MKRQLLRILALTLCVLLLFSGAAMASNENIMAAEYLPITRDNFVADSLYGVDALYNLNGPTYYCTELIVRYYKTLYGIDVVFGGSGPKVKDNVGFWFETTDAPVTGDVLYASAASRGKGYSHAALVKTVNDDGSLTLIEQNWRWNNQAGVNRVIAWPGSCYTAYTLRCASGVPTPKLPAEYTVSDWASDYIKAADGCGLTADFTAAPAWRAAVTRGQLAALVSRAADELLDRTGSDAYALGLMSDASREDDSVTREAAAMISARLLSLAGLSPEADYTVLSAYTDRADISPWARSGVAVITQAGLMSGTDGSFAPSGTLTLEQAVVLLTKICQASESAEKAAAALAAITPEPVAVQAAPQPAVPSSAKRAGDFIATESAVTLMIGQAAFGSAAAQ